MKFRFSWGAIRIVQRIVLMNLHGMVHKGFKKREDQCEVKESITVDGRRFV